MKIYDLLSEALSTGSNPQLVMKREPELYTNNEQGMDASFALEDRSNGVIYAVDIIINPKTGEYRLTDIDVQDHGNTYDGDEQDAQLIQLYLKDHLPEIIQHLSGQEEHYLFKKD